MHWSKIHLSFLEFYNSAHLKGTVSRDLLNLFLLKLLYSTVSARDPRKQFKIIFWFNGAIRYKNELVQRVSSFKFKQIPYSMNTLIQRKISNRKIILLYTYVAMLLIYKEEIKNITATQKKWLAKKGSNNPVTLSL